MPEYSYDDRMDALGVVLSIQKKSERQKKLQQFIEEEKALLHQLKPVETTSQALTTAQRSLKLMQECVGTNIHANFKPYPPNTSSALGGVQEVTSKLHCVSSKC